MKRLHVEVTAEDIANGTRKSACNCPVALATKRAARVPIVAVDLGGIYFADSLNELDILSQRAARQPDAVKDFIVRFDDGDTSVKPFAFNLYIQERP